MAALEQQYDQVTAAATGAAGGLTDDQMPTAEEFAAQVEQFLSSLSDPGDAGEAGGGLAADGSCGRHRPGEQVGIDRPVDAARA